MTNFAQLADERTRAEYFFDLFYEPVSKQKPIQHTFENLLGYIAYTATHLRDVGFDDAEATSTAAQSVFHSLHRYLEHQRGVRAVVRLDMLDGFIRVIHGVDIGDFPTTHTDPVVAAFYSELGDHLLKRTPDDPLSP